jgi:division protein CdvB (Snf7/Vps24/ESCRT-III family)
MHFDKSITAGNIVTWAVLIVSIAMGYAKLQSATLQNAHDARLATELAARVEITQRETERIAIEKISLIREDLAESRATIRGMDKKLDEVIARLNKK